MIGRFEAPPINKNGLVTGGGGNSFTIRQILRQPIDGNTDELPKKRATGGKLLGERVSMSLLPSIPYSISPLGPMKGRSNQFPQSGNTSRGGIPHQNKPPNA